MDKSLKQTAEDYEAPKIKTIDELEVVSVDAQIVQRKGKSQAGEEYDYNVVIVNGLDYRVPDSVLSSLKAILQKNEKVKTFSVSKEGTGMNTKYTVIPN